MDPTSHPAAAANYNHLASDPRRHAGRALALHVTGLLGAGQQDTQGQARQATGRRGAAAEGPEEAL